MTMGRTAVIGSRAEFGGTLGDDDLLICRGRLSIPEPRRSANELPGAA